MFDVVWTFDREIAVALNGLVGRVPVVDNVLVALTEGSSLRGGIIVALLWAAWIRRDLLFDLPRSRVIATLVSAFIAVAIGRALQELLPARARPINVPELALSVPAHVDPLDWSDWSSFPSDHATLFVALGVAILLIDRRLGLVALAWIVVGILLPRVYLGIHFASDIIAGMALGVAITLACFGVGGTRLADWLYLKARNYPRLLMVALFLVSYEIAQVFDTTRAVLRASSQVLAQLS